MDWSDILRAAAAFFLVLTGLSLCYVLVRLASTLARTHALLGLIDRETLPLIGRLSTTIDRVNAQLDQVERILETTADGVESADRTVRRVGRAVEAPVERIAGAGAFVRGTLSSFRARRGDRSGSVEGPVEQPPKPPA